MQGGTRAFHGSDTNETDATMGACIQRGRRGRRCTIIYSCRCTRSSIVPRLQRRMLVLSPSHSVCFGVIQSQFWGPGGTRRTDSWTGREAFVGRGARPCVLALMPTPLRCMELDVDGGRSWRQKRVGVQRLALFHRRRRGQRTTPTDDRILSFPPLPCSLRPVRRTQRQESKSVAPRSRSSGRLPADAHCLFPGCCSPLHSAQSFVMRTLLAILSILSPTALEGCICAQSYRVSVCSTHRPLHAFLGNRSSCSPYSTDRIHNEWIFKARRKQVFSSYDTILPSLFGQFLPCRQYDTAYPRRQKSKLVGAAYSLRI
ncbi:hypothetical protein DFH08DRAFT_887720 [Mycena albidolilacea]|uniref:Uncharacterized protein n=1 Tax=Mycena albidolilacea TaxID=1033008 RepID=A0AAD6ZHQ5_9AGAR|nr:hypothetical protein DFH08DRAFT_887720 [Mycena albidolilacea]